MPAGIAVFDCALLIGRLAQEVAYFKSLDWSFKAPEVTYLNSFIGRVGLPLDIIKAMLLTFAFVGFV